MTLSLHFRFTHPRFCAFPISLGKRDVFKKTYKNQRLFKDLLVWGALSWMLNAFKIYLKMKFKMGCLLGLIFLRFSLLLGSKIDQKGINKYPKSHRKKDACWCLLLLYTAVCFRCCFFFEICSKVSQNGPATQLQLSATQLQLRRNSAQLSCNSAELQTILFKRLSCTFRGLSCTPLLTATQSFPTFKKHYKPRATQRNSLQLTGPKNRWKNDAELQPDGVCDGVPEECPPFELPPS